VLDDAQMHTSPTTVGYRLGGMRRLAGADFSRQCPRFAHTALHAIFAAELAFSKRFGWPVGHSICALAKKPD